MGRQLQKKKQRSSRPKVKQAQKPKKPLNPLGNDLIAKNWDKKQTLSQNYRRLGLVARLQAPTGGVEPRHHHALTHGSGAPPKRKPPTAAFGISPAGPRVLREARVERDESGRIVRVLSDGDKNPLNDLLNEFDSDEDSGAGMAGAEGGDGRADEEWGGIDDEHGDNDVRVVRELEREASRPTEKRARHQSQREIEWLQRLVDKHGDDTAAMARDTRINRMQQTGADIAQRIRLWRGPTGGM